MPSLLEALQDQLSGSVVEGMSRQIGADERVTGQAISALVPTLIGALANNSQNENGAASLHSALERDHDGSLLEQISSIFGSKDASPQGTDDFLQKLEKQNRRAANSSGILGHVLGGNQESVHRGMGEALGLNGKQIGQLLAMLAPMVMGSLGKMQRQEKMQSRDLSDLLRREREDIRYNMPDASAKSYDNILDSNKDGKVDMKDDVAKVGMALGAALLLSRARPKRA